MDVIGSDTDPEMSMAAGSRRTAWAADAPEDGPSEAGLVSGRHFTVTNPVGSDKNHSDRCFMRSV